MRVEEEEEDVGRRGKTQGGVWRHEDKEEDTERGEGR